MSDKWSPAKAKAVKEQFYNFLDHVRINSKEKGQIVLGQNLYDAQHRFFDAVFQGLVDGKHDFKHTKSRQLGITTGSRALTVFWGGVFPGMKGYLLFDTGPHLEEARLEMINMITMLPPHLNFPTIERQNRYMVGLKNSTALNLAAVGVRETNSSGSLGRSSGVNLVHASECSSYGSLAALESFRNALAEDYENRLFIWESTGRGYNIWHEMVQEAKADAAHQVHHFSGWWSKNNQIIKPTDSDYQKYGTQAPSEKEAKRIAEVRERYGVQITPEQLAWIRRKTNPLTDQTTEVVDYDLNTLRLQEQPWCVTRETRVGTNRGILRIEDAVEGLDSTLGKVLKAGPTGKAVIWKATTKLGYEVRGTGNHPLINQEGEEVRIDSALGAIVRLQPPMMATEVYEQKWKENILDCSVTITPAFARFVGLYMGDGSAYGSPRSGFHIRITCDDKDRDVQTECERLIKECFALEPYRHKNTGCTDICFTSRRMFEVFRALELTRIDTGRTMRRIHVPEFIWRSPKPVIKEFLSGLFEADGFNAFDTHRVVLFSKYKEFIQDVQRLLLAFGITCRSVSLRKKTNGYWFTGHSLELRKSEAIKFNEEIGFISKRKRDRYTAKKAVVPKIKVKDRPIVLEDEIVSIVCENVVEEVFNLTVDGTHWFDANGILTHNTEDDVFLMTGSSFFEAADLTRIAAKSVSRDYKSYSYAVGLQFMDCKIYPSTNPRGVELKVWDGPVSGGVYALAADVAFGANPKNDRSAIQVLRCYSDCVEQVAEYAWPLIRTEQFSWVIASLLGWYGGDDNEVYLILEYNGPGEAVWNSLTKLKNELTFLKYMRENNDTGLLDIFRNVSNYIYGRADSLSPAHNLHWRTTPTTKVPLMEGLRDYTSNGRLIIKSQDTLEEMKAVTRDGAVIEAQGRKKDDRVMALAMGVRCWLDRVQRGMMTQKRTKQNEDAKRRLTISDQMAVFSQSKLDSFFAGKQRERELQIAVARRRSWRGR